MNNEYGERICIVCKKKFIPGYPAQVTCSGKCKIERKQIRDRLWKIKKRQTCADLDWLNSRMEAMIEAAKSGMKIPKIKKQENPSTRPEQKPSRDKHSQSYRNVCANCGCTFKAKSRDEKYCSDQCAKESAVIDF